jgi:hypothetical protein
MVKILIFSFIPFPPLTSICELSIHRLPVAVATGERGKVPLTSMNIPKVRMHSARLKRADLLSPWVNMPYSSCNRRLKGMIGKVKY